jgi:hypothetical protein
MESLWTRERINTLVDESKQGGGIYLCHWRRRASCHGVHFRMIRRWEDLTIAEFLTICDGERGRMILYRSTFLQPAVFAKKLRNLSSLAGAWQWTFLGKLNNVDVAVKLNFLRFPPLVSPKFTSTTVMRLAYLLPLESSSAEVFVSADFQSKSIGFAWLARVKIVWPNLWCSQQEIAASAVALTDRVVFLHTWIWRDRWSEPSCQTHRLFCEICTVLEMLTRKLACVAALDYPCSGYKIVHEIDRRLELCSCILFSSDKSETSELLTVRYCKGGEINQLVVPIVMHLGWIHAMYEKLFVNQVVLAAWSCCSTHRAIERPDTDSRPNNKMSM